MLMKKNRLFSIPFVHKVCLYKPILRFYFLLTVSKIVYRERYLLSLTQQNSSVSIHSVLKYLWRIINALSKKKKHVILSKVSLKYIASCEKHCKRSVQQKGDNCTYFHREIFYNFIHGLNIKKTMFSVMRDNNFMTTTSCKGDRFMTLGSDNKVRTFFTVIKIIVRLKQIFTASLSKLVFVFV